MPRCLPTAVAPAKPAADAADAALRAKRLESRLSRFSAATVYSLTTLLDLRDLSTGTHGTRLAEWAVQVGELAGLDGDELHDLEVACLLHDVGKVGLPDAILDKPGKLTDEEFAQIKKHPDYGWAILRLLPGFERISLLVLHHHERIDGRGYPAGLQGEEIPLAARIVAVVDAFDAMVSDRPYRKGLSTDRGHAPAARRQRQPVRRRDRRAVPARGGAGAGRGDGAAGRGRRGRRLRPSPDPSAG